MSLQNCWEFEKCGRQPGGSKIKDLGICLAPTFIDADGFGGGKNGGRACIYITGTLCGGIIQGSYKEKEKNCLQCDFYHTLMKDKREEISLYSFINYVKKKRKSNKRNYGIL